jgi:hypothetical protein
VSELYHVPASILTIVTVALAAVMVEAGFRIGQRRRLAKPDTAAAGIGPVEGVVFGLFGLLIAFTFSFVIARYELRRQLVVDEANAIETSYLRSAIAPAPERALLEELHRRYLASRIRFIAAGTNEERDLEALSESLSVQQKLWSRAVAIADRVQGNQPYWQMLEAQNKMFNAREERIGALAARLPDLVVLLLLFTAVLTASVTGYALGLKGERHPLPSAIFLVLTAVVLFIVIDLDRPRRGILRTSETALTDLAERLRATP